ncbi:MAG: DUF4266 domain-containing protein [Nitrospirae bacterium]|nr:DUF4266 domain-containing protein [Nitrospirota bacterium]
MKICLLLMAFLISVSGCASVRAWEKEYLADRIMQFDADKEELAWELHMLPAREGAAGGYGGPGGGCGCN